MEDCVAYFAGDQSEMLESDVSRHNQLLASFLVTGDLRAYQQSLVTLLRDELGIDVASIGGKNWKCSHISQLSLLYNLAVTFFNELNYHETKRLLDIVYNALMQDESSINAACIGVRLCILWIEVSIRCVHIADIGEHTREVQAKLEQANKWLVVIKSKITASEDSCKYVELMLATSLAISKTVFFIHCRLFDHATNELNAINESVTGGEGVVARISHELDSSNGSDGDAVSKLKSYLVTLSPDTSAAFQLLDPLLCLLNGSNSRITGHWLHQKHRIILMGMYIDYKQGQFERCGSKLESFLPHCKTNDPALLPHVHNNLGGVYMRLRRHYSAVTHYNQALQLLQLESSHSRSPVYFEVKYNCGIGCLYLNKPLEALKQFKDILPVMGMRNPSLWLRMAECCIMQDCLVRNQSNELVIRSIAGGRSRRLLITSSVTTRHSHAITASDMSELSTMLLALQAEEIAESCTLQKGLSYLNHALLVGKSCPSPNGCVEETVLVKLMYTHLSLNDPAKALLVGEEIMKSARSLKEQNAYLVKLYCTEALCLLGRADDAMRVFNTLDASNQSLFNGCAIPYSWTVGYQIPNSKLVEISALLLQAGIHIAAGRYVIAKSILDSALRIAPRFVPTVKTLVYTLLRLGMAGEAAKVLRGYS